MVSRRLGLLNWWRVMMVNRGLLNWWRVVNRRLVVVELMVLLLLRVTVLLRWLIMERVLLLRRLALVWLRLTLVRLWLALVLGVVLDLVLLKLLELLLVEGELGRLLAHSLLFKQRLREWLLEDLLTHSGLQSLSAGLRGHGPADWVADHGFVLQVAVDLVLQHLLGVADFAKRRAVVEGLGGNFGHLERDFLAGRVDRREADSLLEGRLGDEFLVLEVLVGVKLLQV